MSKPLPIPLANAHDLFEKLKRDAALLEDEVTTDRFFNFVITSHALIEWVTKDPAFAHLSKQSLHDNRWVRICGDLANASKHFQMDDRRNPITASAESFQGYGTGGWGKGGYGVSEESILIKLNDGTTVDFTDLIREVTEFWVSVLEN